MTIQFTHNLDGIRESSDDSTNSIEAREYRLPSTSSATVYFMDHIDEWIRNSEGGSSHYGNLAYLTFIGNGVILCM